MFIDLGRLPERAGLTCEDVGHRHECSDTPDEPRGNRTDQHAASDAAFLATVNRVPHAALGVSQFGQSGSIEDLYRYNGIDTDSIIRAALDLI